MAVISNGTTIMDAGVISAAKGALTLITTLTASNSATLTFASGINSTYDRYLFKFISIHPTHESSFSVNFRDGSTAYDAEKTTTNFRAFHFEDDSNAGVGYQTGQDLTSATGFQLLGQDQSAADNDASGGGYLEIYNPSSTDLATSFIGQYSHHYTNSAPGLIDNYVAGYCSTAAAIDGVQFKMDSNNISTGIIKMYGVSS
tara:strand:- start:627 stop:1229 length:603 start_codon:yes stop_codon:yes gene_type:complete